MNFLKSYNDDYNELFIEAVDKDKCSYASFLLHVFFSRNYNYHEGGGLF